MKRRPTPAAPASSSCRRPIALRVARTISPISAGVRVRLDMIFTERENSTDCRTMSTRLSRSGKSSLRCSLDLKISRAGKRCGRHVQPRPGLEQFCGVENRDCWRLGFWRFRSCFENRRDGDCDGSEKRISVVRNAGAAVRPVAASIGVRPRWCTGCRCAKRWAGSKRPRTVPLQRPMVGVIAEFTMSNSMTRGPFLTEFR